MHVLLVEDDPLLGETIEEYLKENNITVKWIQDDREIDDIFDLNQFDVIVLDLMLKYRKGEEILRDIRNRGVDVPVLILTAKSDIRDKEVCFNLGADDYLTKPFDPKELLLRLKALSKRKHREYCVKIGDITIDIDNQMVYKKGEEVKLSRTAWELLYLLVKNRGSIVPTERILAYVWGDKPVGDEIVRTYIKELRKILPKDAIVTYKGRGYKLN
ncbi:MAG TPA: DNA-binding response regulator [Persephonella sp.]|uniref:Two component transcriptional regulator, winged helix family n=1 Tax=Persephonella marina (strain DSM 14350 / EX-H1) TaxID=123214 RepID=C0QQJ3_PERMH|nr:MULTISPECIES: response regulator transcription factor [Persephonella]ACO03785.1 two component transcriptional regulator, winged helix family [Persephonella marina EX-H1]HCB69456.1 DNA-binding response regulator [Persephonella sp.]